MPFMLCSTQKARGDPNIFCGKTSLTTSWFSSQGVQGWSAVQ